MAASFGVLTSRLLPVIDGVLAAGLTIRYGPALKWAIQGQFTTFQTSGGEGGSVGGRRGGDWSGDWITLRAASGCRNPA